MEFKPLISVIMPVYNAENRLRISIQSVLDQTYENIELILINDGSKDKSGEICEAYTKIDSRIKLIHQENFGVSTARNRGLAEVTGDYLTFMDSDDTIECETYQKVIDKLTKNNFDIVIFGMCFDYYNSNLLVRNKVLSYDENIEIEFDEIKEHFFQLFDKNYLSSVCNKVIKASLIRNNGLKFQKEMVILEDFKFNLDILEQVKKIFVLEETFYHYYNNLTIPTFRRRPDMNYYNNFRILDKKLRSFSENIGLTDRENIGRINSMILRFYIIGIEIFYSGTAEKNEKFKVLKHFINNNHVKKSAKLAICSNNRLKVVRYLILNGNILLLGKLFNSNDLFKKIKRIIQIKFKYKNT